MAPGTGVWVHSVIGRAEVVTARGLQTASRPQSQSQWSGGSPASNTNHDEGLCALTQTCTVNLLTNTTFSIQRGESLETLLREKLNAQLGIMFDSMLKEYTRTGETSE